jgi:hypothetical protein
MGSLILLLLVIDRRAKIVARAKAEQAALRLEAEDAKLAAARVRELERRRALLREALHDQDGELQRQLSAGRNEADVIAKQIESERHQQDELKSLLHEKSTALARARLGLKGRRQAAQRSLKQAEGFEAERARMTRELEQLEGGLADLKEARKRDPPMYSLVPYRGRRGDNRKPIYIECAAHGIMFHPDRLSLDVVHISSMEIRAEVERRIAQRNAADASAGTPYLLMLVRPDGIETYYHTLTYLSGLKIDFGYEFIESDWVLDFPEKEDGAPQPWMTAQWRPPAIGPATPPGPLPRPVPSLGGNGRWIAGSRSALLGTPISAGGDSPNGGDPGRNGIAGAGSGRGGVAGGSRPQTAMAPGMGAGRGSTSGQAKVGYASAAGAGGTEFARLDPSGVSPGGVAGIGSGGSGSGGVGLGAPLGNGGQGSGGLQGAGSAAGVAGGAGGSGPPGSGVLQGGETFGGPGSGSGGPGSAQQSIALPLRRGGTVWGGLSQGGSSSPGIGSFQGGGQGSGTAGGAGRFAGGGGPGLGLGSGNGSGGSGMGGSGAPDGGTDGGSLAFGGAGGTSGQPGVGASASAGFGGAGGNSGGWSGGAGGQGAGAPGIGGTGGGGAGTAGTANVGGTGQGTPGATAGDGASGQFGGGGEPGGALVPGSHPLNDGAAAQGAPAPAGTSGPPIAKTITFNGVDSNSQGGGTSNIIQGPSASAAYQDSGNGDGAPASRSGGRAPVDPALRTSSPLSAWSSGGHGGGGGGSGAWGGAGSSGGGTGGSGGGSSGSGQGGGGSEPGASGAAQTGGGSGGGQGDGAAGGGGGEGGGSGGAPGSSGDTPGGSPSSAGMVNSQAPRGRSGGSMPDAPGADNAPPSSGSQGDSTLGPLSTGYESARGVKPRLVRPSRLLGNRDWIIPVECTSEGVVVYPFRQRFSVNELTDPGAPGNALFVALHRLIERRQATLLPGELPYRPIIRFLVRPDASRTYYLAYPALDRLQVTMTRENLDWREDIRARLSGP